MDIYCLEGMDEGGTITIRVFIHLSGYYERTAEALKRRHPGIAKWDARVLSIEDVLQFTDKGGQYLAHTSNMVCCGLTLFVVEMEGGAVTLWGPNPQFVRDFESQYSNNNE